MRRARRCEIYAGESANAVSIEVIQLVLYGYHGRGKEVLIVLADHANKQGGNARPSVARIGALADLGEGQVRKILRMLRNENWIIPVGHRFGGAPGASVSYQFNIEKLYPAAVVHWERWNRKGRLLYTPIAGDTPVPSDTPVPEDDEGCPAGTEGCPAGTSTPVLEDRQSVIDPSLSEREHARAGANGLAQGAAAAPRSSPPPQERPPETPRDRAIARAGAGLWKSNPNAAVNMANDLGIGTRPGESYAGLRARIEVELESVASGAAQA